MTIQIPMQSQDWAKTGIGQENQSLMTPIALVEGEVLETIESRGPVDLSRVLKTTKQPKPLVVMSVGALVRDGLVRATKSKQHIVLESIR
jgi:hypothetical protein